MTLTGAGLPASKDVTIAWMTANIRYVLDAKPDSVDYIGRKVDKIAVALAKTTTSAAGALSVTFTAPLDFGGIHDIYAVVSGVQVAKSGFLLQRKVTISPTRGPIGTTITIKVVGMGSPTYESVGSVLYDNRFTGSAGGEHDTRCRDVQAPCRGRRRSALDRVRRLESHGSLPEHGTVAGPVDRQPPAQVHGDEGRRRPARSGRVAGSREPDDRRAHDPVGGEPHGRDRGLARAAELDERCDPLARSAHRNRPDPERTGRRCRGRQSWATASTAPGTCWSFVDVPLGGGTAAADGSLRTPITVPDGLGGWHVVQVWQAGKVTAQVPYYVKRSFVAMPKVVKAGKPFVVELKGVGWTQLDNTVAVTYDNAYIGYACGFNSNGYVRIQLLATGKPGTHLIDLYPLLYTQQPAYPYPQLGMVPLLSFAQDAPGLAAGYQLPAFRLAIKVVA